MNRYTLQGVVALAVALWALAAFTADRLPTETIAPDQITPECDLAPAWANTDAWWSYGDCSGDYGPIDAAE